MADHDNDDQAQQLANIQQMLDQMRVNHPPGSISIPSNFEDGNIVGWLEKFNVCATANQWDDATKLRRLPSFLNGRAFAIYSRFDNNQKGTIQNLTNALLEAFLPPEARGARYMEFELCTKKSDESVDAYVYRLEQLFSQALPDVVGDGRDAILKQKLIRGMPEPVKLRLLENPTLTYTKVTTTLRQLLAVHNSETVLFLGVSIGSQAFKQNEKKEPDPNFHLMNRQNSPRRFSKCNGHPFENWNRFPYKII